MSTKKMRLATATIAGAGAILFGGAAFANAAVSGQAVPAVTDTSSSDSSSPSTSATPGSSATDDKVDPSGTPANDGSGPGRPQDGRGDHAHTTASAVETASVTAAVKAKDSAVTITKVLKDADGSFDAFGTKGTARIMFDVSADFKTVTEKQGGPGRGGERGNPGTVITGAEADKVAAAVKAKDSAVTVTTVTKRADGSYGIRGTKADAPVHFSVSADFKTITERTGGPGRGGPGGRGGHEHTAATADETAKVTAAVKAKDATVTVTQVRKDPDGSFDVDGTKAGAEVRFDVSADLKTITER